MDAAGLLLIRGMGGKAEVLMGRRNRASSFMPGVYVFPGGRVERADARPSGFTETMISPPEGTDNATRRHLTLFARAALRETFEETGLLVAERPGSGPAGIDSAAAGPAEVWRAFRHAGRAPAFSALALVARAVTPTRSPIRFHTRFFRADGQAAYGNLVGDGELEDLRWVPVEEAGLLPIAEVTALVLREALAHGSTESGTTRPAALFRWVGARERPRHALGP
ncbi:MAG: NUDIX hydrolase [Rhodospirillales bacterium]|nr:NUDIX hydrolase [Rhodospirillales bacterium]